MEIFRKRALYESIMQDVAITVKKALNEAYKSSIARDIIAQAVQISKENPKEQYELAIRCETLSRWENYWSTNIINGKDVFRDKKNVGLFTIGSLTDECFDGEILYAENDDDTELYNIAVKSKFYIRFMNARTQNIIFIIKLSQKGIEFVSKLIDERDERKRNRNYYEEGGQEYERKRHKSEMKYEKRFREDKKEADEIGVSVEDYINIGIISERLSPFGDFDDYRENERYIRFLEERKGIVIDKKTIRKTLLRALSKFNN